MEKVFKPNQPTESEVKEFLLSLEDLMRRLETPKN
jgi:hypothetical protein